MLEARDKDNTMPADMTVHRASICSHFTMLFLAVSVLVAPSSSHAQSSASPVPTQVELLLPVQAPVDASAERTVAQLFDEAAMATLEAEIDVGPADDENVRPLIEAAPVSLLQMSLLVLAALCLLAFAGVVLTLALRELRKEKEQRRRTYRRRVKRRSVTDTVATS